jgi:hypothetical protein
MERKQPPPHEAARYSGFGVTGDLRQVMEKRADRLSRIVAEFSDDGVNFSLTGVSRRALFGWL